MKIDLQHINLRNADDNDRTFAYEVKKAALRAYVEPLWGWDEVVQVDFHRKDWSERRPEIICLVNRDIGTIEVWRREQDIHLGEFYLFPEFQRRGIGSHLMSQLSTESDATGVPLRLEVIKINPVKSLYIRFGFKIEGETNTHFLMQREPNKRMQATGTSPVPDP